MPSEILLLHSLPIATLSLSLKHEHVMYTRILTQLASAMEEEKAIRISDLIQRRRPFTAASSLVSVRPISTSKHPHQNHNPSVPTPQTLNSKTLKPVTSTLSLIGTLTLPSFPESNPTIKCSCFQFSDDSATVCCHVLNFDPKMIGCEIEVLAWNFIPVRCGAEGYLEIIRWNFVQAFGGKFCCLSDFSSSCLTSGACDIKDELNAKCLVFGLIESVSPISVVPCASRGSVSKNISGFLVNVLVCDCKFCSSKFSVSKMKSLTEENIKDHSFIKTAIVYFCGLTSSWHPGLSGLIGYVVSLSRLKKKLVFIRKEESQLMYVTTDSASLHVLKLFKKQNLPRDGVIRGKGECGSYTGVITGVYMQGMIAELDKDVMLLLTDQYLSVPHCLRVGAIVTLKNVHFVVPKFSWGKMLILGACCRTSVCVESFSPLESGCHLRSNSQGLLQKFLDSLSFSARLWVLLLISCFRRKFAGILSEKEILGSKHKEGLVQKYATSHLPLSAFRFRHGVLLEFCKHDSCYCDEGDHYGHLRLVLPVANLIDYIEVSWKKILHDWQNCADFVSGVNKKKPTYCGGRFYAQSVKRVICTEEIGVLVLGTLKISLSSGRLQLVDATGGVDVMLDLPATWDFDRIFEVKNFIIVTESLPQKPVDFDSIIDQPLSCRSIFSKSPILKRMEISLYLYHDPSREDAISHSLFFDYKRNSQELESGKYHLLMMTHKFPVRRKFQVDKPNRSNKFAQAIVLPWDLLVAGKHESAIKTRISLDHFRDTAANFAKSDKSLTNKRCKVDIEALDYGFIDVGNESSGGLSGSCSSYSNSSKENTNVSNHSVEAPCLIASKGSNCHSVGILHCTKEPADIISDCKPPRGNVLLEFGPDRFCTYEVLRIGCYYLFRHQEEDKLCSTKKNYQSSVAKVFICSGTNLWSVTLSSIESLQSSDFFASLSSKVNNDDVISKGFEIPCLTRNSIIPENYSDINLFVPVSSINSLENVIKILGSGPFEPTDSFKGESDTHDRDGGAMINASVQSSCNDCSLPVGNLISLHGLVVALHDYDGDALLVNSRLVPSVNGMPRFLRGNGGVCIHLLVEDCTVTILCDLSKQDFPVGLGQDIYATFHRVLALSGKKKYMMTPVSFITVSNIGLLNGQQSDEFNDSSGSVGLQSVASPNIFTSSLISDALQLSQLKPMKLRCRVVAVYVLVMEKTRKTGVHQSRSSGVGIPLAGFVLDDGSSSCCCWVESDRAASLLGLDFDVGNSTTYSIGLPYNSTPGHLNRILEQHGRVVVKNYGSIFDSSSQDLTFSVGCDKSISSSDEDFLTSLIISASFNTFQSVVVRLMDRKESSRLKERLTEVDMAMPPLQNVWATSVCHIDMLEEARNIIQGLV